MTTFQSVTIILLIGLTACNSGIKKSENTATIDKTKKNQRNAELPEKIHVKLNQSELIFVKEVIQEIQFSTGNGLKEEKKWGFIESTFTRSVIYSATNANQLEIEK